LTGDCDDFRASVHPGAIEQCDLKDNDCDGNADEDVIDQPYCEDHDGDGYGVMGGLTKVDCKPSAGFGDCTGDCDDRDANVHPGAAEACDGRDNNCDGKVDEGVRPVCGVGLCARYAASCIATCSPGAPFAESCNGYDDDCDGVIDNGSNEQICGDANVPCVQGQCAGSSASTGGSASAGGTGASGSATASPSQSGHQGLAATGAPASCTLGSTAGTWVSGWLAAAWMAAALAFRRRAARQRETL
jgi:hypothetical protein